MDYQNSLQALQRRKGRGLDLTIVLAGDGEDEKAELDELGLAPMIEDAAEINGPEEEIMPRDAMDGDMHAIDEELGDEHDNEMSPEDLDAMASEVTEGSMPGQPGMNNAPGLAQKPETYNMQAIGNMLGAGGGGLPGKAAAYHASKPQAKNEHQAKKDVKAKG